MIPQKFIQEWQNDKAPWVSPLMVEQDLIISRALVNLYEQPEIKNTLVFRGGTALNKLYIQPASRYSEDIDFVQVKSEPIGPVINAIRVALDPWLGEPKRKMTERSVKLVYRYLSSENFPAKLKVEINTTEHYHMLDLVEMDYEVESEWFSGTSSIVTYQLDELMGTKLRALYQRRKGRDLFDLWYVLQNNLADIDVVLDVFNRHNARLQQVVTRALFEKSFIEKMGAQDFSTDMKQLLHPRIEYNFNQACRFIMKTIVEKLPGDPWKKLQDHLIAFI